MLSDKTCAVRRCPCDDCHKVLLCRTQMLACHQYARFQRHGVIDKRLKREPSRERFEEMISNE